MIIDDEEDLCEMMALRLTCLGFLPLYLTVQDVIKQFNRDVKVWTRTAKRSSSAEDIDLGMFTEYLPDDTGSWLTYNWAPSYRVYFKGETRLQVVLRRCYTLDEIEAKRFGTKLQKYVFNFYTKYN